MGLADLLRPFRTFRSPAPVVRVPVVRVPEPRSRRAAVQLEDEGEFRSVVEQGEGIRRNASGVQPRQRVRVVFRVTNCETCGLFRPHQQRPDGSIEQHWETVGEFWSGEWRSDLPLGGVPRPDRGEMIEIAQRYGARFCDVSVQGDF